MVRLSWSCRVRRDGVGPPSETATATIRDDDIRLRPVDPVTITEGETRTITLVAGTGAAGTGDGALRAGARYHGVRRRLLGHHGAGGGRFAGGGHGNCSLVLLHRAAKRAATRPAGDGDSVTIEDNDELSASVTVPEAVAEGETAPFTVTLGGGESTAPVVVSYTVGGTAKAPGDYTAPSGSLTIQSGESSGTIRFRPTPTMRSSRTRRWW